MASMQDVGKFFGDLAFSVLPPIREDRLKMEAQRQSLDLNKAKATMQTLDQADRFAQDRGEIGTSEYADAFDAYASQAGIAPEVSGKFRSLKANAQLQKQKQLTWQAEQINRLRQPEYGKVASPGLASEIEDFGSSPSQRTQPNPQMGSLFLENRPTGGMQLLPMGPNQAASGLPRSARNDMVPETQVVTARRRTPVDLVAGADPQVVPPTPEQVGQVRNYGELGAKAANWLMPESPTPTPIPQQESSAPKPSFWQQWGNAIYAASGGHVPESGVTAATTPKTFKQMHMDTDTAEQFQTLESMVGKGLPQGFDLRSDFARDPQFYRKLLTAIREGVPDPKNPAQRRKLSTKEIIDIIAGR